MLKQSKQYAIKTFLFHSLRELELLWGIHLKRDSRLLEARYTISKKHIQGLQISSNSALFAFCTEPRTLYKQIISFPDDTIGGLQVQCWVPLVANQFPAVSPFMNYHHPSTINQQRQDSVTGSLLLPETQTPPARTRSFRKNREVKFHKNIIK